MKNLIFIGMIGGGLKSVAENAANILGRKYVDTDEVLTRNTGLSLHDLYTMLPLDSFKDLTYRLAAQLSDGADYVIAVGDSILKNPDAISTLKESAFTVYISQNVDDIIANCTDPSHTLLARGFHRLTELYREREGLFNEYADISIVYSENAADLAVQAYNNDSTNDKPRYADPALHAFFRYYLEKVQPEADSSGFADECCEAVNNILNRYISEVTDNEH